MPIPLTRWTAIAAALGSAELLLVGWTGLLVPSVIRSIEPAFGQADAGAFRIGGDRRWSTRR